MSASRRAAIATGIRANSVTLFTRVSEFRRLKPRYADLDRRDFHGASGDRHARELEIFPPASRISPFTPDPFGALTVLNGTKALYVATKDQRHR